VSCYIIGPRKGRFNSDGTANDMPGHSVPLAALGGGILLVCFLAFNGGSQVSFIALIFKIERSIEKYYLYLK